MSSLSASPKRKRPTNAGIISSTASPAVTVKVPAENWATQDEGHLNEEAIRHVDIADESTTSEKTSSHVNQLAVLATSVGLTKRPAWHFYAIRIPREPLMSYADTLFSAANTPFVVRCRIGCYPSANTHNPNLWILESNFFVSSAHLYSTMTARTWSRIVAAHNQVYGCEPKYFPITFPGKSNSQNCIFSRVGIYIDGRLYEDYISFIVTNQPSVRDTLCGKTALGLNILEVLFFKVDLPGGGGCFQLTPRRN